MKVAETLNIIFAEAAVNLNISSNESYLASDTNADQITNVIKKYCLEIDHSQSPSITLSNA